MNILESDQELLKTILKPGSPKTDEEDADAVYDKNDQRELEEDRLPDDAECVAEFNDELETWTSWILEAD